MRQAAVGEDLGSIQSMLNLIAQHVEEADHGVIRGTLGMQNLRSCAGTGIENRI